MGFTFFLLLFSFSFNFDTTHSVDRNDKHGVRKLTFRPSPELDRNVLISITHSKQMEMLVLTHNIFSLVQMPVKIVRNVSDGNGVKADVCFYATTGDLDQGW